jgi:septation ring formation regulator EzrA
MTKYSPFVLSALLAVVAYAPEARAADRFEVTSIKAVRPTLVKTVDALQKNNPKAAKEAFAEFDSAWNGIEVYINTRSADMYNALEREMQAKLTAGLAEATPNVPELLPLAKTMLVKFDEAIALVEKGQPLNPSFDDVARLRIVRARLREMNPALKAGDLAKARKSFVQFDEKWDSVEDIVKERNVKAYATIEDGMTNIGIALKRADPDAGKVQMLVSGVMDEYNKIVAQVTKEARGQ